MANITKIDHSAMLKITKWLGLNEAQDGDTNLRPGELAKMENMRITREGHLQKRPGSLTLVSVYDAWNLYTGTKAATPKYCGMWHGYVNSIEKFVAAYGGVLWDISITNLSATAIGELTQDTTTMFGFSEKMYVLNGHEYKVWDGTTLSTVEGYKPLVQTATTPAGSGTLLQGVNKLNAYRRVRFSPDGTSTVFQLPQKPVTAITSVVSLSATITLPTYTTDLTAGTVTFASTVAESTNTVEITYTYGSADRSLVEGMKYACMFNGSTDARMFIYGDGTNKTLYSDLTFAGEPTAEYFPDLNEMEVGDENTPVTSLVRHFSRLLCFKPDSAYSVQFGDITLADGSATAAFYVTPVNDILGCEAYAQGRNMENNPITLCNGSVYQWKSTNTSGNITRDERSAKRISDRVENSFGDFTLSETKTFNDLYAHEMYFICNETALVYNYAADAWYKYKPFPVEAMIQIDNNVYSFHDGKIKSFSRDYRTDDGTDITVYAETGSMPFDRDYVKKYSGYIFVSLKPESGARITVTAQSNRRSDYNTVILSQGYASFAHANFAHWSFNTNYKPQMKRAKVKVKRCVYYKLIFEDSTASSTCTILSADIRLQYNGAIK